MGRTKVDKSKVKAVMTWVTQNEIANPVGMSLRDYFAAAALQGLLAHHAREFGEPNVWYNAPADRGHTPPDDRIFILEISAAQWSVAAYRFADAMLAERDK